MDESKLPSRFELIEAYNELRNDINRVIHELELRKEISMDSDFDRGIDCAIAKLEDLLDSDSEKIV